MVAEPEKWKMDTNDRYSKIVASIVSLATGSLVLPALFLREFLSVPKETALLPFLNWRAYTAWACLGISILLGLVYSWLSVKWVKVAWGQNIMLSENRLECLLDTTFVAMVVLFLAGIGSLVYFFATFHL